MNTPPSAEAAYGHAHGEIVRQLQAAGCANPHPLASDILASLTRAGWAWRNPHPPPPRRGPAAEPTSTYQEAREALRRAQHPTTEGEAHVQPQP